MLTTFQIFTNIAGFLEVSSFKQGACTLTFFFNNLIWLCDTTAWQQLFKFNSCAEFDTIMVLILRYNLFSSLLNQTWSKPKMQKLAKSLARCTALSVLE